MTILFATDHYSPHVNGVVRQVMMLRQELLRRGHRVLVLTARIGEITNKEPDIFYLPSFKTYTHADDYFTMPFNKKVEEKIIATVSYTHLTLPTIYSV